MGIMSKVDGVINWLALSAEARTMRKEGLTYLSPRKLRALEAQVARVNSAKVEGDIAEFGLALGGSAILMAKKMGQGRTLHGFDVFGMIPEPNSEKDGEKSVARYEAIKSGKSKGIAGKTYYGYQDNLFDTVSSSFDRHGVRKGRGGYVLHKGLFEETWDDASTQIRKLAVVHIDCDWYDPVKFCLERSDALLSVGGAIIIDDYFAYPGAKDATDEFIAANLAYQIVADKGHLVICKTA